MSGHTNDRPILAAGSWKTNGEMIADAAELYFPPEPCTVLDPTYGRGKWWTVYRPPLLYPHDIARDGVDFRDLPYVDDNFDAVAFDPPYVSVGGRKTTTLLDHHDRYGLTNAPRSPRGVQRLIEDGFQEATRVTRPGGVILVKCQDYISSGKLWPGTYHTTDFGFRLGLELLDRWEFLGNGHRPQPKGRRQVHARRNYSTLLIWRKP